MKAMQRAVTVGAFATLATVATLGACGPKVGPTGISADDAIVKVTSNVRDAQVFVDGRFIAPLGALRGGVAVGPGLHRFELRHEDYFSRYLELRLARAEKKVISLEMAPILP